MKQHTGYLILALVAIAATTKNVESFAPTTGSSTAVSSPSSALRMGLFDSFRAGGSGRDRLDEEWEKQQELLRLRRAPKAERDAYFGQIEQRRREASEKQQEMWGWQSKQYKKGEDPLDEWKKRRAAGTISDLDDQYGDPKKIGGIPLPMASFGVGGEFGVGGKYDNGGRFDLRLPYADQGYVDDDADVVGKFASFFGASNKKKKADEQAAAKKKADSSEQKKGGWPW